MPRPQRRPERQAPKLRNYTTEVAAQTSIDLIKQLLRRAGAREIAEQWDQDGATVGILFKIQLARQVLEYRMPARTELVWRRLRGEFEAKLLPGIAATQVTRERAANITWRTLHIWLEAQLDLILTGMGDLREVMLPYMLMDVDEAPEHGGRAQVTVYEYAQGVGLLPAPSREGQ